MKQLTTEQMAYLSKFESRMHTATNSQWCSAMSATELQGVTDILNYALESNRRSNANCASCVLETMTDIGRIYFAQKEAESATSTKKVATRPTKAAKVAGVAVKTKKMA